MNQMKKMAIGLMALAWATTSQAQSKAQYPELKDSAYLDNPTYQQGNKYQRDAMLFMDMLTDTHPYYIKKDRRDSLMATLPRVLKACGECSSDTVFTQLLQGILGDLRDKHTDVIDPATLAKVRGKNGNDNGNGNDDGNDTLRYDDGNDTLRYDNDTLRYDDGNGNDNGNGNIPVMAYGGDLFHYRLFPEHSLCYLQFNQCQDARTARNESLPRWDTLLDEMFAQMKEQDIQTLVVDAQYNNGGSSMLCDELLIRLRPLDKLERFTTSLRFSNLMGTFNPRIITAKKAWEEAGHIDELYRMPEGKVGPDFVQPEVYKGNVVFIQSQKTYSSAGILMTLARDNRLGTILGQTSTFSPSHYGEILPFTLPNTGELGSVSTKFFARPDSTRLYDKALEPMVPLDLSDKEAAWQFIVSRYGQKPVKHPRVVNEEYIELAEIIGRLADNSIFNDDYAPRYQADVEKHFAAFREHPAVKWMAAHESADPWINFDAVPWIGAHAKLVDGQFQLIRNCNPDYDRWPKKAVREFLPLMSDFYNATNFHQFYQDHTDMYEAAVEAFRRTTANYIDLDWFEAFFGTQRKHKAVTYSQAPDFSIVVALNNGGGSFGIQRKKPGQNKELLSVMLYAERRNGTPAYDINSDETLILVHEFCHSYLTSPKVYKAIGTRLLEENRKKMKSVGYGIWQNVIEESLVRMSVIRYMIDHNYPEAEVRQEIENQHQLYGFKWLPSDPQWYKGNILNLFDTL